MRVYFNTMKFALYIDPAFMTNIFTIVQRKEANNKILMTRNYFLK